MDSRARAGAVMVVLSGASFGGLGVFSRHLRDAGLSVPSMLCARFLGGAAVMWALAVATGAVTRLPARRWLGFVALGALYVGEAWTYFESANRIPVALTALLLYLYPALVALARRLFWAEPLGVGGALALVLALAGVGLAVGAPAGELDPVGLALGLVTAGVYSTYVLLGAGVQRGTSPTLGSAWVMTTAAVLFGLLALATGGWHAPTSPVLADLVGLVIFGTVLPIPLLLAGLARVGPTRGSIISSVEPISAALCGAIFLGEPLSGLQLVGGALVLAALVVLALRR